MERPEDLDFEHQLHPALGEVIDGDEVGDGRVVYEDVDRAVGGFGGPDQFDALFFVGKVALDGEGFATGIADALDDAVNATGEHVVAFIHGADETVVEIRAKFFIAKIECSKRFCIHSKQSLQ